MGKGKRFGTIQNTIDYTEKDSGKNKSKTIFIILAIIIVLIILFYIVTNFIIFDKNNKFNLVINNNNITANMKNDIIIEDDIIYLSEMDVKNFFDKYIYEIDNMIVTTYDKKIAEIGFESNIMKVNDSNVKIDAPAKKTENGEVYLPISEMKDIYGIEIEKHEDTKVITMDSIDREQKKYTVKNNAPVKSSTGLISKTIERVKKGEFVVKVEETSKGWTKIRTDSGKVGFIKSNKLDNEILVRENMGTENQVEGKVNMVWDYYSPYGKVPDRSNTKIEGVNVVSPAFFYLDNSGKLIENINDEGKKYIEWAHSNGYKIWPMVKNSGENMLEVTSNIMNDYKKRKELIESIADVCVKYDLDGINIDFENMKQEDKDLFSRFIIELTPRIKDLGDVISVDVTAPDGGETWSMCYDRLVIGDVANYIVFMAYDQYGVASTKPGTTAGYNWAKVSLEKFLTTEEIEPEKIILGIPFYTRLWTEGPDGTATSTTVAMKDVNSTLPNDVNKTWNDELKQNYVEYQNKNNTMKMWIEDEDSLKAKLSLIPEYKLGGVAEWQKDMEEDSIWSIINTEINN